MHVLATLAAASLVLAAATRGAGAQSAAPEASAPALPAPHTMAPLRFPPALALGARQLRGVRTASGFRITGQALVRDACTAARLQRSPLTASPPTYDVLQYRRPGTEGLLCIAHQMWVAIVPLNATTKPRPASVRVRSAQGTAGVAIAR